MLSPMAGVRRARRRFPVRTVLVVLAAAVIVTALVVSVRERGGSDESAATPRTPTRTPLADFDTTSLTLTRGDFCALVDPAAVEDVLGGKPRSTDTYANGDARTSDDGRRDVAHEYGCTWTAPDGTTARAWIFAPPVTADRAAALRAATITTPGCTRVTGAAAFGDPTAAVRCQAGGSTTTTYQGLFGDAWLSCSLGDAEASRAVLRDRTGRWCVAVAKAAAA